MTKGYDRLRRTAPRRLRLAGRMVDMQLTYRPGDTSSSGYDGPEIIGGIAVTLRLDGRLHEYGYGYVLADGTVDVPDLSHSDEGELGDYDTLGEVLRGDHREEIQDLVPTYVQPWRWRGSRLTAQVTPASTVPPPGTDAVTT